MYAQYDRHEHGIGEGDNIEDTQIQYYTIDSCISLVILNSHLTK